MNLKNIKGMVLLPRKALGFQLHMSMEGKTHSTPRGQACVPVGTGHPAGTGEGRAQDCLLSSPGRRGCCLTWDLPSPVLSSQVRWDLYLVSLFTSRNWAGKRLLLPSVHAHGAEDGLRADGALCGPGLIAVRLLVVHLLLVVLTACRATEQGLLGAVTSPQVYSGPRGQEEPGTQGQDGQLLPWERAFQAQEPANIIWSWDRPGGKVSAFPSKRPG